MSVSSIASSTSASINPANWRSTVKQGRQDFSKLLGSLQSGDVSGAQQAFSAMQQLLPGLQANAQAAANPGNSASSGNTIITDFSALGKALSSGSLADSQGAIAKLQQDVQTYRQGLHQFGNQGGAGDVYKSMQQSATGDLNPSNPLTASNSTHSFSADMTALSQALQSGNLSSAQSAFAQLQQDLQSIQQGQGAGHHHHHHAASGSQDPVSSYIANSVLGSSSANATTSATVGSVTNSSIKVSA